MSVSSQASSPKKTYADVATPPASPRGPDISALSLNSEPAPIANVDPFPPLSTSSRTTSPLGKRLICFSYLLLSFPLRLDFSFITTHNSVS